jgi:hypothetical protein
VTRFVYRLIAALVVVGMGYIFIHFYEYIFAKNVEGELVEVARVTQATAIIGSDQPLSTAQMYSYAISIEDSTGHIYTASSEDRQWAAAPKGYCAKVRLFPYPPWDLSKADTYHNARLIELINCKHLDSTKALTAPSATLPMGSLPTPVPTPAQ